MKCGHNIENLMFRSDPIAIVLGRDVAQLIHRIIHRKVLNELNAEYHRTWSEKLVL